jgi:pyridoxamine 5'-phosphate oxidase family protein
MVFSEAEQAYLNDQPLGRLATLRPDGAPQVNPVGFRLNPDTGTIDISGFTMSTSQKFRNVATDGRVSLVVDDIASYDPWRVRCLEIRGTAEAVPGPKAAEGNPDGAIIRITPTRVLSFGIDHPGQAPHEMTTSNRDVDPDEGSQVITQTR